MKPFFFLSKFNTLKIKAIKKLSYNHFIKQQRVDEHGNRKNEWKSEWSEEIIVQF